MKKQIRLFGMMILICAVQSYAKLVPDESCDNQRELFNDDYTEYRKKFKTTPRNPIVKEDTGMYTPTYYQGHPYHGYYSFGSYTGRSLYF